MITARHGQSPIDPNRYVPQLNFGTSPATLLSNAGFIPESESTNNPTGIGPTEEDVSLLWLKNSSDTDASVKILEDNGSANGIALGQIYSGASLAINTLTIRGERKFSEGEKKKTYTASNDGTTALFEASRYRPRSIPVPYASSEKR